MAAMEPDGNSRLANLVGAMSVGVADAVRDSVTESTGLDEVAATTLVALLDFLPGGSIRRLSQTVGLTHSGAVRVVGRLVDAGLVRREPGADGRLRELSLTRKGRSAAHRARAARAAAVERVLGPLGPADRATLTAVVEPIVRSLTAQRLEQRQAGQPPNAGALCRLCDFAACGRPQTCPAALTVGDRLGPTSPARLAAPADPAAPSHLATPGR
jgi:DNA-binding MarR family transcriptional regulator